MFFGGMGGPSRSSTDSKLYDILKVSRNAQPQEIKKSYQKLAREFHPDKNPDPAVAEKFKDISYAYEVLMDERKRQIYDQVGMEGLQGGAGGGGGHSHDDLLSQMFGGGGMGGMGGMGGLFGGMGGGGMGGARRRQPQRAQHTVHPLKISLEEMYTGKTSKLQISRNIVCKSCAGKGGRAGAEISCKGCKGHGIRLITKQIGPGMIQQMQQTCPECRGAGKSIADKDKCPKCKGACTTSETKVLQVAIAPGSVHEQNIRLQGEGDQTPGAPASDIIIVLDQKEHDTFTRQGSDLHMKHKVCLKEALTGTQVVVRHVDGTTKVLTIAPGDILSPECTRCVRGLGMPTKRDQSILGDLFIKFDVDVADTYDEATVMALAKLLSAKDDTKSVAPPSTALVDECVLQPFEERHFRSSKGGPHGATCEDSDEDVPNGMGGQRVQCANQ